jgi:TetR/AcrR family transcriptional regulator, lmrAB and yxaGH operons repressor
MPKETYIPSLLQLFRQYGYDGATLSKISEVTGLGKASLYHHFPGGKDEMVTSVMDYLDEWVGNHILPTLQSEGTAQERLQRMCERLCQLYEDGQQPCISATLLLGSARDLFHNRVEQRYRSWITAIAEVLMAEGFPEQLAWQRGEDAVAAVQGGLILSQGLGDCAAFPRMMQQLPQLLCRAPQPQNPCSTDNVMFQ